MLLYPEVGLCNNEVPDRDKERYEEDAAGFWDRFYHRNADKFYKDRHYFDREFPDLITGPCVLLEVGCGAGNTIYPCLEINPHTQIYACDFSSRAVEIVKAHPQYEASGRVKAFVADITSDNLTDNVPANSVDLVTMVFVLSAISPDKMHAALDNISRVLKPGSGRVLFRDYARGDLAQDKHQSSGAKKLGDNFYVRGDGTRCYYFSEDGLAGLFAEHGFSCISMKLHERDVENHKRQITMHRRWVQAVFQINATQASVQATANHSPPALYAIGDRPLERKPHEQWRQDLREMDASEELPMNGMSNICAILPMSLDSADDQAKILSPFVRPMSTKQMEDELDREFFDAISRDPQDVLAEDIAAASSSISTIRLADPLVAAGLQAPITAAVNELSRKNILQHQTCTGVRLHQFDRKLRDIVVQPGLAFKCSLNVGQDISLDLALASLLAHCPRLLISSSVVEMHASASGVAAMTAVRSARRVLTTSPDRPIIEMVSANLHLNASRIVVERLKACHLPWGHTDQIRQALRQVPSPPGCFDLVIASGLVQKCLESEEAAECVAGQMFPDQDRIGGSYGLPEASVSNLRADPAVASFSRACYGGLSDALSTARQLVEVQQQRSAHGGNAALQGYTWSVTEHEPSISRQQMLVTKPTAASWAFAVFLESKGVLAHAQQRWGLLHVAARWGWRVAEQVPEEVTAWLQAGQLGLHPAGQLVEVLVLVPSL